MHVALATCADLPGWEIDDKPLHAALTARGATVARPVWSDAGVDWSRFDACLIRTTWDYHERRREFLEWTDRVSASTRLFNPGPIVRWNTHKSYLRDLEARAIPVVPTVWLRARAPANLETILAQRGWRRAFLKPAVGATAHETIRFDLRDDGLARAQTHADRLLRAEDLLLQPYLERVETEGERSAIFIDGHLSHAVRKVPVPGDYRVQDDFGGRDEPIRLEESERALAERTARLAAPGLLYARVDMLRDEAGNPLVTELELVEPSFFFRHAPEAAGELAEALLERVRTRLYPGEG